MSNTSSGNRDYMDMAYRFEHDLAPDGTMVVTIVFYLPPDRERVYCVATPLNGDMAGMIFISHNVGNGLYAEEYAALMSAVELLGEYLNDVNRGDKKGFLN